MADEKTGFDFDQDIDRRVVPALKVRAKPAGRGGQTVFAAGVADMDFRAPPVVLAAMQRRLDHGVFGYEAVSEGLFAALMRWYRERHAWDIDAGHILRAPNILNALAMAVSLFTERGDGIIIQPPVFFDFFDIIHENGRTIVSNPLTLDRGRYRMDFAGLEALARNPRTTMLFLCNPHNPVGRVWSRDELLTLAAICLKHDVLVVSDEIHGDLTFAGHAYTPFASLGPAHARNAIVCLSPAKTFNIASCCSAFTIVADAKRRAALQAANSRLTVNKNNAFANVAMQAAWEGGAPWLDAVLNYLHGNLALVEQALDRTGQVDLIRPDGTFLLWLDFRKLQRPAGELKAFLREKAGWMVTGGDSFGKEGEGFARVNIACPRARLEAALQNLLAALQHQ